jgi:D-beta-D-heptose 7-phosphate kinase/D-beta-D-heptose 1-phosphate adenosyltransferase
MIGKFEDIRLWCEMERARRCRINMTNGCFDILHVDHLKVLRAGSGRDEDFRRDDLIVAIDSDERVRQSKGHSRPVMSANDRAELLLSTRFVSRVVVFDSVADLRQLYSIVRPDMLVRGTNGGGPEEQPPVGAEFARRVLWVQTGNTHSSELAKRLT